MKLKMKELAKNLNCKSFDVPFVRYLVRESFDQLMLPLSMPFLIRLILNFCLSPLSYWAMHKNHDMPIFSWKGAHKSLFNNSISLQGFSNASKAESQDRRSESEIRSAEIWFERKSGRIFSSAKSASNFSQFPSEIQLKGL